MHGVEAPGPPHGTSRRAGRLGHTDRWHGVPDGANDGGAPGLPGVHAAALLTHGHLGKPKAGCANFPASDLYPSNILLPPGQAIFNFISHTCWMDKAAFTTEEKF